MNPAKANHLLKYTGRLLRRIMKSVRPCTLFMANFGKAEISLLFKPAASVPLLKILNVSEPPRTAGKLSSSDVFAQQKLAFKNLTRRSIFELATEGSCYKQ